MRAGIVKRSVKVGDRETSVSVEEVFWSGLRQIAKSRRVPVHRLLAEIEVDAGEANLSSAIRVAVFQHFHSIAARVAA